MKDQTLKLFMKKIDKAINYKVTKKGDVRHRVMVTFQITKRAYRDPYDSSKGIRTTIEDKNRDMFMTNKQIAILDNKVSGRA